jgi:hypothetical protein
MRCDNYPTCKGEIEVVSHMRARVRGWRIFSGASASGKTYNSVLCPLCVGQKPDRKPKYLEQEEKLW